MEDLNPVSRTIALIVVLAAGVWLTWCTVIAFTGGLIPLLGWEVDGGIVFGLFWLFIVDPIAATVAYWVGMLVTLPLVGLSEGASAIGRRGKR